MDLEQIRQLAIEYGNATFDCGEHNDESSEPYEAISKKASAALERLMDAVTALGKTSSEEAKP